MLKYGTSRGLWTDNPALHARNIRNVCRYHRFMFCKQHYHSYLLCECNQSFHIRTSTLFADNQLQHVAQAEKKETYHCNYRLLLMIVAMTMFVAVTTVVTIARMRWLFYCKHDCEYIDEYDGDFITIKES